ncbi:putative Serine/threonine-protein kinase mTOR [Paratrimastix pyriformis]|uniref:non-specific serine/threonine protein kinase n=1 Tax=Paratrimastix pyriformis TaxID=342808 RepID=A0ABQ8US70_9EUKA|nr:putative Serine/threonine-protein kinase mTOR [Paratrimastix pyriformis]
MRRAWGEQAILVAQELIRVAVLWNELWFQGLEEASRRFYYEKKDIPGCVAILNQLHNMETPETLPEKEFVAKYGAELKTAYTHLRVRPPAPAIPSAHGLPNFEQERSGPYLTQAWEIYTRVWRKLRTEIPALAQLDLTTHSPRLAEVTNLKIAVPGTYQPDKEPICIQSFDLILPIIASKQRPRRLTINGSDQHSYQYLLKGHEDIRQDERVMQLFGLVNTLLAGAPAHNGDLFIRQYPVIPLSPNSGLIGWVQGNDTFHQLVKTYRAERKLKVDEEHRLILRQCADENEEALNQQKAYDVLTLLQKVEIFNNALAATAGRDIYDLLWLRSQTAEVWLERRTCFTQSLAVMSMVGHILGLGDRHPSNLMLDRATGKVVHIDFGDCFEVAMEREKHAEKVPFRLTRMLVNAMEISGIEGSFRLTCEKVMGIIRENKGSIMAMLEAFVYDPLINWRLLRPSAPEGPDLGQTEENTALLDSTRQQQQQQQQQQAAGGAASQQVVPVPNAVPVRAWQDQPDEGSSMGSDAATHSEFAGRQTMEEEVLNAKAVHVCERVRKKLAGKEFGEQLSVPDQVDRLIEEAISHENLCQLFVGWCPFW